MKFKKVILIFLLLLIVALALFLNHYLKINNLLFYATGTKEKAFINATWGMSPLEIERANNISLKPGLTFFMLISKDKKFQYPKVIHMDRYKSLDEVQEINLWGFDTKVNYAFFDNRLFEYTLNIYGYNLNKLHEKVSSELIKKFGNGINENDKDLVKSMLWDTETILADYWISRPLDHPEGFMAGIRVRYKPLVEKIRRISHEEEKGIF